MFTLGSPLYPSCLAWMWSAPVCFKIAGSGGRGEGGVNDGGHGAHPYPGSLHPYRHFHIFKDRPLSTTLSILKLPPSLFFSF